MRFTGLELCSDGHEEVCFNNTNCPACAAMEELNEKIKELETEKQTLENDCEALHENIAEQDAIIHDVKRDYPEYLL